MTDNNNKMNTGDDVIIILHGTLSQEEQEKVKSFAQEALAIDKDGVTCMAPGVVSYRLNMPEIEGFLVDHAGSTVETGVAESLRVAYEDHKEQGDEQTFVQIFIDHISEEDVKNIKPLIGKIASEVKDSNAFKIQFLGLSNITKEAQEALEKLDDELTQEGVAFDIVDYASLEKFSTLAEAIDHSLND